MPKNAVFTDVRIFKSVQPGSLAYGQFQIAGSFWIDFTLRESTKGKWVGLPSYATKKKDEKTGKTMWRDQVQPVVDDEKQVDLRKDLLEYIKAAYENLLKNPPQPKSRGPVANEEVPF